MSDDDISQWIRKYNEYKYFNQEGSKMIILRLRLLLHKLKVTPMAKSSFDSEAFIRKYKVQ